MPSLDHLISSTLAGHALHDFLLPGTDNRAILSRIALIREYRLTKKERCSGTLLAS
jgi:hypothetical protein